MIDKFLTSKFMTRRGLVAVAYGLALEYGTMSDVKVIALGVVAVAAIVAMTVRGEDDKPAA